MSTTFLRQRACTSPPVPDASLSVDRTGAGSKTIRIVLPLLVWLAACGSGGDEGAGGHRFRIEEGPDGVPISYTSMTPLYEGELFHYEEVVVLRQDYERPESLLNRPISILVGEDGYYYVADFGDVRIAVYDQQGRYSHQIGRKGEGPGEFQYPTPFWISGDRVFVFDSRSRRTSVFRHDGTYLDAYTYRVADTSLMALYPNEDGSLLLMGFGFVANPDRSMRVHNTTVVVSAERDTLRSFRSGEDLQPAPVMLEAYRVGIVPPTAFGGRSYLSLEPGTGVLNVDTQEGMIEMYDFSGLLKRVVRMDAEKEPVGAADRAAVQAYYRRSAEESEDEQSRARNEAYLKTVTFADTKPYFETATIDDAGYFWLSHPYDYTLEEPYMSSMTFRILSPEGEYLEDTTRPDRMGTVSRGFLCVLRADEESGEIVPVIYRITPAVPGLVYP